MKNLKILSTVAFAFVLGLGVNNFAMSQSPASYKVAVVDVPKLVESSNQVKALKKEQLKNIEDMKKFVENAKADVDKQSTDDIFRRRRYNKGAKKIHRKMKTKQN